MKRQENRAVLVWRGAASAGLFSSADRAYMKAPVPSSYAPACGQQWPEAVATLPAKVAGQRATVKAEMNGFAPGLDRRPLSR